LQKNLPSIFHKSVNFNHYFK